VSGKTKKTTKKNNAKKTATSRSATTKTTRSSSGSRTQTTRSGSGNRAKSGGSRAKTSGSGSRTQTTQSGAGSRTRQSTRSGSSRAPEAQGGGGEGLLRVWVWIMRHEWSRALVILLIFAAVVSLTLLLTLNQPTTFYILVGLEILIAMICFWYFSLRREKSDQDDDESAD
jgi:hypothetical protein